MGVFVVLVDGFDYVGVVVLEYGWMIVLGQQVCQCGVLGIGIENGDFVCVVVYWNECSVDQVLLVGLELVSEVLFCF